MQAFLCIYRYDLYHQWKDEFLSVNAIGLVPDHALPLIYGFVYTWHMIRNNVLKTQSETQTRFYFGLYRRQNYHTRTKDKNAKGSCHIFIRNQLF